MKVVTLVAFSVFVALSAEAGQPDHKHKFSSFCDNAAGHCKIQKVAAPKPSKAPSLYVATSARKPRRAVDANGNVMMVTVGTAYGFNIAVPTANASKFQNLFALLKDRRPGD